MRKFSCPACGAEVELKSSISLFAVCEHCNSTLLRDAGTLRNLGKMAQLPEDMSPLQLGARGLFAGNAFEIVGRLKLEWSDGNWNEWFALFDDGNTGWLAEAQGQFMMSFEVDGIPLPALAVIKVGLEFPIGDQTYGVDDIKQAVCVGSEGELPFQGVKGRRSTCVDLSAEGGKFASLDYGEGESPHAYEGQYAELEDLQFTNLRELDGW